MIEAVCLLGAVEGDGQHPACDLDEQRIIAVRVGHGFAHSNVAVIVV